MESSYTFYFEEIFPTLLDFETFIGTYSTVVNLNNPNEDNPLNTDGFLGYISQQTFNKETANRLRSYLDALNNAPSMNIYKFFKANKNEDMGFDDLFMNVQPNLVWFYKK